MSSKRHFRFGIGRHRLGRGKRFANVYVSRGGYRLPHD